MTGITLMAIAPEEWGDDREGAAFDQLVNMLAGYETEPAETGSWDDAFRLAHQEAARLPDDVRPSELDATHPVARVYARINLANLHKGWKSGDSQSLTGAIGLCAGYEMPLPEWVGTALIECHNKVASGELKSWDDALGRPFPKGAQVAAMKRRHMNRVRVWLEALRLEALGVGAGETNFHLSISAQVHLERSDVYKLLKEARELYSWIPWGNHKP